MDQEERIITVYLMMETVYKELTVGWPVRQGGFPPALTDSELLTMEIIGESEGRHGDRAIWRYFNSHGRGWFPALSAYQTFAKQCWNPGIKRSKDFSVLSSGAPHSQTARNWRRRTSLRSPNRAMSLKVSAPQAATAAALSKDRQSCPFAEGPANP